MSGVRYSAELRESVVEAVLRGGRSVASVAGKHGISASTVRRWVRGQQERELDDVGPVVEVVDDVGSVVEVVDDVGPAVEEVDDAGPVVEVVDDVGPAVEAPQVEEELSPIEALRRAAEQARRVVVGGRRPSVVARSAPEVTDDQAPPEVEVAAVVERADGADDDGVADDVEVAASEVTDDAELSPGEASDDAAPPEAAADEPAARDTAPAEPEDAPREPADATAPAVDDAAAADGEAAALDDARIAVIEEAGRIVAAAEAAQRSETGRFAAEGRVAIREMMARSPALPAPRPAPLVDPAPEPRDEPEPEPPSDGGADALGDPSEERLLVASPSLPLPVEDATPAARPRIDVDAPASFLAPPAEPHRAPGTARPGAAAGRRPLLGALPLWTRVWMGVVVAAWAAGLVVAATVTVSTPLWNAAFVAHALFLVVGFGAVVTVDWHGVLWMSGRRDLGESLRLADGVMPLVWIGVGGLLVSGALLGPDLSSPLTWLKLVLVLVVALNGVLMPATAARLRELHPLVRPRRVPRGLLGRLAAVTAVSQLGWLGAIAIGFANALS